MSTNETRNPVFETIIDVKNLASYEKFKKLFTFVTDCAAKITAVSVAFSSPNEVPYSDTCVECIAHKLSRVITHAYGEVNAISIQSDMNNFKTLSVFLRMVASTIKFQLENVLKRSSYSVLKSLDKVDRFILSPSKVVMVINNAYQDTVKSSNDAFDAIKFW